MNSQWVLDDYGSALARLKEALEQPVATDLIKAGCIQYFEFCFELAWKSIKVCGADLGLDACLSPKSCLKQAFRQGWIDHEKTWLEMLDARNRMAHTYSARSALDVYERLPRFLPELLRLHKTLSKMEI